MLAWHPPRWLPDCVAKLGFLSPLFERVDGLTVSDATDAAFDRLERLPYVRQLTLGSNGPAGRAIDRVSRLPSLECLELNIDRLSGEGIPQLSSLPKLKRLMIDGIAVDDATAAQVSGVKSLDIWQSSERGARSSICTGLSICKASRSFAWAHTWTRESFHYGRRATCPPNSGRKTAFGIRKSDSPICPVWKTPL